MARSLPLSLAIAAAALLCAVVDAKPEFPNRLPNGKNVPGVSALGHADGSGASDKLNAFGKAFDKAGQKWTTALCQADSDGDGQTNGQELGDPCCVWTNGATPKFTSGMSHPGDPSKTVTASVLASYTCGADGAMSTAPSVAPSSRATGLASSFGGTIVAVAAAAAAWTQW